MLINWKAEPETGGLEVEAGDIDQCETEEEVRDHVQSMIDGESSSVAYGDDDDLSDLVDAWKESRGL